MRYNRAWGSLRVPLTVSARPTRAPSFGTVMRTFRRGLGQNLMPMKTNPQATAIAKRILAVVTRRSLCKPTLVIIESAFVEPQVGG